MWFWQNYKGGGCEFGKHCSKLSPMCPSVNLPICHAFSSIKPWNPVRRPLRTEGEQPPPPQTSQ